MTALRELAERWKTRHTAFDVPMDVDRHSAARRCADELLQILDAEGDAGAVYGWIEGYPNHVYASEWFIAHTIYGDRVVLRALPDEYSYDFTTADHTYMRKENIKRWMQFPDSDFIPSTRPQPVLSGVVSDEQAHSALMVFRQAGWEGGRSQPEAAMRAALTHFAKSLPAVDGVDKRDAERYRYIRDNNWSGELYPVIVMHKNAIWDTAIDADINQGQSND